VNAEVSFRIARNAGNFLTEQVDFNERLCFMELVLGRL
jgi:hypothetical protein